MLLEYFLNLETPELSSDTKVSTKSNLILSKSNDTPRFQRGHYIRVNGHL